MPTLNAELFKNLSKELFEKSYNADSARSFDDEDVAEHAPLAGGADTVLVAGYRSIFEEDLVAGYSPHFVTQLDAKKLDYILRDKHAQQLMIQALNLPFADLWEKGYTDTFESPLHAPAGTPARVAWLQVATEKNAKNVQNAGRVILCERTKGSQTIEVRTLPQLLACLHYKKHRVELNTPELNVWTLRLLHMAGIYQPKMPEMKVLPYDAPIEARQVAFGLRLLIGLRSGYVPDGNHNDKKYTFSAAPFSQKGFGAAWSGLSLNAVSSGIKYLRKNAIIQRASNVGTAYTYYFDRNERAAPGPDQSVQKAAKRQCHAAELVQALDTTPSQPAAAIAPDEPARTPTPKPEPIKLEPLAKRVDDFIRNEAQADSKRQDLCSASARRFVNDPYLLASALCVTSDDLFGDLDTLEAIKKWDRILPVAKQ